MTNSAFLREKRRRGHGAGVKGQGLIESYPRITLMGAKGFCGERVKGQGAGGKGHGLKKGPAIGRQSESIIARMFWFHKSIRKIGAGV